MQLNCRFVDFWQPLGYHVVEGGEGHGSNENWTIHLDETQRGRPYATATYEVLGITDRAVPKWETGKSLPDASIMLELCSILKITTFAMQMGRTRYMKCPHCGKWSRQKKTISKE